ncbi:MAG: flap structure-specific endonuclease [Thermoplasmata archaeon]|nr:flap structure-specific endonuclease [Thermoplasmata archaeon]
MGLPFRDLVTPEELPWESLAGKSIAVDAYNAVYQFLATIRQRDGQPFSDPEGRTTSHLMGVLGRTTSLLGQGVLPAWVFDGKPPDLKAGTLRERFLAKERAESQWKDALAAGDLETARRKAAQTSRYTRSMAEETKELLEALGVPAIQAPSEGEAQAAQMAANGVVWASASEDYDSLLFHAPRLVRGLAARMPKGKAPAAQIIDRPRLLEQLGINDDELLMIGLLVGTDFSDGVRGYGPKKALKLVREHLGWEATLARAGLDPAEVEPVAELFRHPETVPVSEVLQRPIDREGVHRILVDRHSFSPERVDGALARAKRKASAPVVATTEVGHQTMLDSFGGDPA